MAESRIRDENYYQIQGFMINRLGLKGISLSVYAIIYGFSQDGISEYTGSLQYLCDFAGGVSKPTVIKALKELTESDLILRREETINNVLFVRYKANLQVVKKLYGGSKEILTGGVKNLYGGSKEILPNNKDNNKTSNNELEKKEGKKNAPASFDSLIDTYSKGNTEIKELLGEWLKVRKSKRAAMTDRAIELNLQKLDRLAAESNMTVTEYLKEVICRGWNAFYPINDYSKGKTQPKPRYGNFDVNEAFNGAVRRTETEMHQSDKDVKTAGEDESIRARAEALRKQFAQGE